MIGGETPVGPSAVEHAFFGTPRALETDEVRGIVEDFGHGARRAVEAGFLPPAPRAGACQWCDFREACGPGEELRISRKPSVPPLEDLRELRKLR